MEGSLALDGIATSAPYNYSALDPKSMEERGVEQFRRKPKFQYVRFMIVPSTIMAFSPAMDGVIRPATSYRVKCGRHWLIL